MSVVSDGTAVAAALIKKPVVLQTLGLFIAPEAPEHPYVLMMTAPLHRPVFLIRVSALSPLVPLILNVLYEYRVFIKSPAITTIADQPIYALEMLYGPVKLLAQELKLKNRLAKTFILPGGWGFTRPWKWHWYASAVQAIYLKTWGGDPLPKDGIVLVPNHTAFWTTIGSTRPTTHAWFEQQVRHELNMTTASIRLTRPILRKLRECFGTNLLGYRADLPPNEPVQTIDSPYCLAAAETPEEMAALGFCRTGIVAKMRWKTKDLYQVLLRHDESPTGCLSLITAKESPEDTQQRAMQLLAMYIWMKVREYFRQTGSTAICLSNRGFIVRTALAWAYGTQTLEHTPDILTFLTTHALTRNHFCSNNRINSNGSIIGIRSSSFSQIEESLWHLMQKYHARGTAEERYDLVQLHPIDAYTSRGGYSLLEEVGRLFQTHGVYNTCIVTPFYSSSRVTALAWVLTGRTRRHYSDDGWTKAIQLLTDAVFTNPYELLQAGKVTLARLAHVIVESAHLFSAEHLTQLLTQLVTIVGVRQIHLVGFTALTHPDPFVIGAPFQDLIHTFTTIEKSKKPETDMELQLLRYALTNWRSYAGGGVTIDEAAPAGEPVPIGFDERTTLSVLRVTSAVWGRTGGPYLVCRVPLNTLKRMNCRELLLLLSTGYEVAMIPYTLQSVAELDALEPRKVLQRTTYWRLVLQQQQTQVSS